ncbi:Heat shock transcription factor [Coemansia aciculifera]|nr:Heat shock transcription factor [Coemansia aciculifera]
MSGAIVRRGNNMHRSMTVTPFLNKLLRMVEDRSSDNLIRWSDDGHSFIVLRHEEFAKEVLPRFFKHSNFSSFVRQLNMYDFHKVPHLQHGGLISEGPEAESWEFSNKNFRRGQSDLLHFIRRKKGTRDTMLNDQDSANGAADEESLALNDDDIEDDDIEGGDGTTLTVTNGREKEPATRANSQRPSSSVQTVAPKTRASRTPPVTFAQIMKQIQVIQDHQMTISSDVKVLQEENQSLWIQARAAEERHKQHQITIDNILQFLARVYGNDTRQPEIRPPLHRLITNSSGMVKDDDSSDSDASAYLGQQQRQQQRRSNSSSASATPMVGAGGLGSHTQEIFETMGLAEMLGDAQQRQSQPPPEKRRRLSPERTTPERTSRIFEMASNNSSPESPPKATGGRSAAHRVGGSSTPTLRRKAPTPQSTALTRTLHRPVVASTQPPRQFNNAAVSSALVPVTGTPLSAIKAQSKSIEQVKQNIDLIGFGLDHVVQQLQSTVNGDSTPDPVLSAQLSSFGAAAATPTADPSAIDSLLQSLPTSKTELDALLTPEALSNLAMSLAGHGFDATMSSGFNGTGMDQLSGLQGGSQAAASIYDPSTSAPAVNASHSAPSGNNAFDSAWAIDMLQKCTPAQYETLYNYFQQRSPNNSAGTAAPMRAATNNGIASYSSPLVNADLTPYLNFVDSNGDGLAGFDTSETNFLATNDSNASAEGGTEAFTQGGGVGSAAAGSVDEEYAKLLLDALYSDPATLSSAIDALGHGSQDDASHFNPVAPTSIFANNLALVSDSAQPTTRNKPK